MALIRIIGREAGYQTIDEIPERIVKELPPRHGRGRVIKEVLEKAIPWYHPLCFRKTDEGGARQAVLRRRPLLTTFHLSHKGWKVFYGYNSMLKRVDMKECRSQRADGGHAVVLYKCDRDSLTFLNSWGPE